MRPSAGWAALFALLPWASCAWAVQQGDSLPDALTELQARGITLVYSSALVDANATVDVAPGSGSPLDIARRILASHGLGVETVRPGVYAVVRRSEAANDGAIELVLTDARERPVTDAHVVLSPGGRTAPTDASGKARIADLPPGLYDATAWRGSAPVAGLRGIRLHRGESWQGPMPIGGSSDILPEVMVFASRYSADPQSALSLAEFSRRDIEALPALDQDALRVTRYMPGTATNGLSSRAYVRGGRDNELAVYFDGVPLFEPFHYKDFQSLLGILDPGALGKIDFYSGVFPARFGGRLSGVMDISPRVYEGENHHELGLSLLYAHAMTQGRLDSLPVEWLFAARRSTVEAVLEAADSRTGEPQFLDILGRVAWRFGERGEIAAGWLSLDDDLEAWISQGSEQARADYRDATAWLRGSYRFDERWSGALTTSRSERRTSRSGTLDREGSAQGTLRDSRQSNSTHLRAEVSRQSADHDRFTFGTELLDFDVDLSLARTAQYDPLLAQALGRPLSIDRDDVLFAGGQEYAVYGAWQFAPADAWRVDLGMRWDAQRFSQQFDDDQWSPRIAAEYRWTPRTTVRLSWGRSAQPERPDELQIEDGEPTFHPVQRGMQAVAAIEHQVSREAMVRVEVFQKRATNVLPMYENILDPVALLPELEIDRVRVAPQRFKSYGAEGTLRWQPPERWSAWLTLGWSEATDEFEAGQAPRTWDQHYSAIWGGSWREGPWLVSANTNWHSGWRRNRLVETVDGANERIILLEPRNSDAWSDYFTLDTRAEWSRPLSLGTLSAYIEVINLTNHGNGCCTRYQNLDGALQARSTGWLPRYALVGVTWQWP